MRLFKLSASLLLLASSLVARADTFTYSATFLTDSFTFTYTGKTLPALANWDGSGETLYATTSCRYFGGAGPACDQVSLRDASDSIYLFFFEDGSYIGEDGYMPLSWNAVGTHKNSYSSLTITRSTTPPPPPVAPTPEPGTMALLGTGLAGLAFFLRRRPASAISN